MKLSLCEGAIDGQVIAGVDRGRASEPVLLRKAFLFLQLQTSEAQVRYLFTIVASIWLFTVAARADGSPVVGQFLSLRSPGLRF
jgi:hypothetical protein